jgi:hypothetical protein
VSRAAGKPDNLADTGMVNCLGQKECAPLLLLASNNYPRSQFAGGR